MNRNRKDQSSRRPLLPRGRTVLTCAVAGACAALALARASGAGEQLITGKTITPAGTQQNVGSLPMNLVLSPDGKYAVCTDMGFHQFLTSLRTDDGTQVSNLEYPTTNADRTNGLYYGLAFGGNNTLYAAQGEHQTVAVLTLAANGTLTQTGSIATKPKDFPSGLATDTKGHLYVANNDPDTFAQPTSVAVYDAAAGTELGRYAFADSFGGTPNFPLAIASLSDGSKVYVASQRDAAIYVLDTTDPTSPKLLNKIPTGSHPIALLLNKKQDRLYVGNAHSDTVSVLSTQSDSVLDTLLVRPRRLGSTPGATPTGLALSSDEKTLFVTLGDLNAVGVVSVSDDGLDLQGYVPVGWYPTGIVLGNRGNLLVSNAKGVVAHYPNAGYVQWSFNANPQYDLNQIEGTVSNILVPGQAELFRDTRQVLENNGAAGDDEDNKDEANKGRGRDNKGQNDHRLDGISLRAGKIKHVIYIVKENRTYDQVLGDLPQGNGEKDLALFGRDVTPNLHALAERFVLLDNFYDCGEASGDGWPWSTQAMANEYVIKNLPYNYSNRGRNYDFEGQDNGYPAGGFPALDPDGNPLSAAFPKGLPPIPDVAEAPGGHIWDLVRKAGLSYRNYGFFYTFGVVQNGAVVIPDNYPAVAGIQPAGHDLQGISDWDFRRYDNTYADSDGPSQDNCPETVAAYGKYKMPSRFSEWNREFQMMLKKDKHGDAVPAFMTVRFHHDHTQGMSAGAFSPRAEVADNDYAVGQLVEAVSKSPIWESTAVFVIEDDAQDGPDHVDCHRSTCYVISPWIKAHTVDHTFYNTDSVLKSMELILGLPAMSSYDAIATPILDWDNRPSNNAVFHANPADASIMCEKNAIALAPGDKRIELVKLSAKLDFDHPDSAPPQILNEILWKSVKGPDAVMPRVRKGLQVGLAGKPKPQAARKDRDD